MGTTLRAVNQSTLILCLLSSVSCATRQPSSSFRVLPSSPNYLLRSPDSLDTPFSEVLRAYNGFELARGWVDVRPKMELRIENAYYLEGMPKRGLDGFLGTETARYQVQVEGALRLLSNHSMKDRPSDQLPVRQLIQASQERRGFYRFYFAIVFKRNGSTRGSVLLGADSTAELEQLAAELVTDPDSVCDGPSTRCTAFPEACTVSVEMEIVVNDAPRSVFWGSLLSSVAGHARHIELLRLYEDRLTPVKLDPRDPGALLLPLLPGDDLNWE